MAEVCRSSPLLQIFVTPARTRVKVMVLRGCKVKGDGYVRALPMHLRGLTVQGKVTLLISCAEVTVSQTEYTTPRWRGERNAGMSGCGNELQHWTR